MMRAMMAWRRRTSTMTSKHFASRSSSLLPALSPLILRPAHPPLFVLLFFPRSNSQVKWSTLSSPPLLILSSAVILLFSKSLSGLLSLPHRSLSRCTLAIKLVNNRHKKTKQNP